MTTIGVYKDRLKEQNLSKPEKVKMIKLRELEHREYENKKCTYFEYKCKNDDDLLFVARFEFVGDDSIDIWDMQIVLPSTSNGIGESQVYYKSFALPKKGIGIDLVCATGLRYFQLCLKDEIQRKMLMDFAITDCAGDM